MANLMAEWLILAGEEISDVQQRVENHLHDMILKTFDPKKADAIFAEEGVSAFCHNKFVLEYTAPSRVNKFGSQIF